MVAIVTPFSPDGQLDLAAWDRLLDFHLGEGTDGIVVAGTTGESPALSLEEIDKLTARAVSRCRGRIPVLVGVGTNSTAGTVARTRVLSRSGVDGVMVVTPYYNKPPQEGLYRHFVAVAEASEVPVVLYNVPGRTGVDLLPATIARLAAHPRIVAVKEASGSVARAEEVLAACEGGFTLLSGDDMTCVALMAIGARGVISVSANVVPRRMHEACAAALRQDMATAIAIDSTLQALHRDLFIESSPIPVKWAVAQLGLTGTTLRLPLVDLTPAHGDTVRRAMRAAGIEFKDQAA
jgi:4-hydroxy-tetrahydrodipicolinate synthase